MRSVIRNCREKLRTHATGLLAGAFALVWWCVLYPELCFPPDAYTAVYDAESDYAGEKENCPATESGAVKESGPTTESCRGLLRADEEQVIVKSRLLEWLEQHIEEQHIE